MSAADRSFQAKPPQVTDYVKASNSPDSDSDDDISLLQSISLQGYETFTEPVTSTGFIYHEKMAEHKCEWDSGYPENPQRLIQPFQRCIELGLVQRCQRLPIRYATEDEIILKHTQDHVQLAQSTTDMTLEELMALSEKYDAWYANKVTYEASLIAAGSTISMVEHILHDKLSNGFAMVRPPGHHAMEQEFNGYCTFNNVALAAQFALDSGISKILIVDWDVHHGQGTQRMFYEDPRVLYFSIHRYEHGNFWPQLRESDYDCIGRGPGEGFNINIPLNKTGMTDSDYMAVFNMVLLPVAYEFQPQLVLISSGYDAAVGCPEFSPQLVLVSNGLDSAIGDEKGEMLVTPAMYAQMTHQLMGLAGGRVCVVLEGGYCLKSLAEGCALTLRSLLRDPCPKLPPFTEPSDSILTTILNAIKILRNYWKCFRHFETLERSEVCAFSDVNTMPPAHNVTFSTPENRPEKFQIMNCYPVQEEKVRKHFADLIHKLIAEANLSVAEYRCCYVFDAEMRSHKNLHDKSHPERPERISKIYATMAEWKLLQKCLTVASRLARKSELLRIHGEDYLNDLLSSQEKADDELKNFPDAHRYTSIFLHQKSVHCALLSCGSLLNVVEAVLRGKAQSGVAIVRPPGHHAESKKAMGFCFINNVAVAAKFAQDHFGLKRILIVDWDVHHGNATQHQFYTDPSVLYISLHRYDSGHFFPGSSDADFKCVGLGPGEGFNVNIPWSNARMGDAEYIAAFTQIIMPIAYQFAPELVLVSAGFDCAVGDPLGGYGVTPNCFGHMTHMLMGLANGRVVLSLEGGYNLNSLSYSMSTCMATLLGYPCSMLGNLSPNERAAETIQDVIEVQKKYWTSLRGNVPVPSVRKLDKDQWVIVKEDRRVKTRSWGSSKSDHAQIPRPSSAHSVRAVSKGVTSSASDSTVTLTSTSHSIEASATTETTTVETDKDTGRSLTQSTGERSGTFQSGQSASDTTDGSSTAESSTASDSDRNESNVGAGGAHSAHTRSSKLQQIPEVPSSASSHSQISEAVAGNVQVVERTNPLQEVASVDGDSGVDTLTSEMGNLSVAGEQLQQVSQSISPSDSVSPPVAPSGQIPPKSPPALTPMDTVSSTEAASNLSAVSPGAGDATGTRPKVASSRELPRSTFRSLIYGNEPDPEPLSIFADNPLMASQEQVIIARELGINQSSAHSASDTPAGIPSEQASMSNPDKALPESAAPSHEARTGGTAGASGSSRDTGGDNELLGACGGTSRPTTVQEFIRAQGVEELNFVLPMPWCPHLTEVRPLPQSGFNPHAPCNSCRDGTENWVCLTCYTVECSRFVNGDMLVHYQETGHHVVLSFADLSVWCYGCDNYVDNEVLFPMKNAAHQIKFGESLTQIL